MAERRVHVTENGLFYPIDTGVIHCFKNQSSGDDNVATGPPRTDMGSIKVPSEGPPGYGLDVGPEKGGRFIHSNDYIIGVYGFVTIFAFAVSVCYADQCSQSRNTFMCTQLHHVFSLICNQA